MAHKKGQGSSRNGRDSNAQRLGVKAFGGEFIPAGGILIRQRGTKFHPGKNVKRARDDSLFSLIDGVVVHEKIARKGKAKVRVNVRPLTESELASISPAES